MVNVARKFARKDIPVGLDEVRGVMQNILEANVILKLGTGLRFPLVNASQPLATTFMVTGGKSFMYGLGKALTPSAWENPALEEITRPTGMMHPEVEAGLAGQTMGYSKRMLSWLGNYTENFNRVWAYYSGLHHFYDTVSQGKTLHKRFARTFIYDKGAPIEEMAHAWAKNITRITQFGIGPEGRALGWTGSAVRGNVGTFKTFTLNYIHLLNDARKVGHDTGDWSPLIRGLGGLLFIGGLPAVAGVVPVIPLWDIMRSIYPELPDKSGIRSLWDNLGLAEPLHIPGVAKDVQEIINKQ